MDFKHISKEILHNVPLKSSAQNTSALNTPKSVGSHGMKISANMSLEAKKKLLLDLEKYRQAKRERLADSSAVKVKKGINKSNKAGNLKNKENKPSTAKFSNVKGEANKESVFERLYKDAKKTEKTALKVSVADNIIEKPSSIKLDTCYSELNISETKRPDKNANSLCEMEINSNANESIEIFNSEIGIAEVEVQNDNLSYELESNTVPEKNMEDENYKKELFQDFFYDYKIPLCNELNCESNKAAISEMNGQNLNCSTEYLTREPEAPMDKSYCPLEKTESLEEFERNEKLNDLEQITEIEVCSKELNYCNEEKEENKCIEQNSLFTEDFKINSSQQCEESVRVINKDDDNLETIMEDNFPSKPENFENKNYFVQKKPVIAKPMSFKKTCHLSLPSLGSNPIKKQILSSSLSNSSGSLSAKGKPKGKNHVRQSISTMYRKNVGMRKSSSEKNLYEVNTLKKKPIFQSAAFTFEDTLNGKNKITINSSLSTTSESNKSAPHLRAELKDWLKVNGHSLEGFRHLRCFGISKSEQNLTTKSLKPASNPSVVSELEHHEDCSKSDELSQKSETDVEDVKNWLSELHRLIVEIKYPPNRCEEWLMTIRSKYPDCAQWPLYWECLAALGESRGDYVKTLNDNPKPDGDSLAELFDKMVIEHQKPSETKLEKGLNFNNIFTSRAIKFALQPKPGKDTSPTSGNSSSVTSKQIVATPVRRSTRIQTPYKSNVVNSLNSLTPEVRKNLIFKTNDRLLDK